MSERIEFFKNRSIGERLSVAIDFLKQNWKALYKNILIGGLPLAIIMGYFLAQQINAQMLSDMHTFFLHYIFFVLISFTTFIYLYAMSGAVLFHYGRNQLTETTGWNDLKDTFFRFAGKTVLITFMVYIPILLIVAGIAAIFSFSVGFTTGSANVGPIILMILLIFLLLVVFIALTPSFTILYFPAYFSGKTNMESIKIAFSLGFKNWGSLFVAILLTGIVFYIFYMLFSVPLIIVSIFSMGHVTFISYILAILSATGMVGAYPIMFIIFAFQYFSIVEKEEGVSLQSRMDEFENL